MESVFNKVARLQPWDSHVTVFQKVSSTCVLLINFISTYSKSLKNFIYAHFLLIEGYKQGALQKELIFAPFVERFKTGTLRKDS